MYLLAKLKWKGTCYILTIRIEVISKSIHLSIELMDRQGCAVLALNSVHENLIPRYELVNSAEKAG